VTVEATPASARERLETHSLAVVLIDAEAEHEAGIEMVKELSRQGGPPVIMMSARSDETDRVFGLELGADDYIVKPFGYRELVARVRAVYRRATSMRRLLPTRRIARFGTWLADLTMHSIRRDGGQAIELTGGEVAVLRAFLDHPGRVLGRQDMLALTRRGGDGVFDRTIDVFVTRLRRKLEPDVKHPTFIRTVRGEGYLFTHAVAWDYLDN
jgi:DNA-binding response OmpR family regulator